MAYDTHIQKWISLSELLLELKSIPIEHIHLIRSSPSSWNISISSLSTPIPDNDPSSGESKERSTSRWTYLTPTYVFYLRQQLSQRFHF